MAKKVIGKIVLYEQLDQDKIDSILIDYSVVSFEVQRQYNLGNVPQLLSAILPTEFADVSIDYVQSLKNLIDVSSWKHEEGAIVYKVKYNESLKEYNLEGSFVRDKIETVTPFTSISTGQLLKAIFTTPGIESPVTTVVDLNYGQVISETDRAKLLSVGLELNLGVTGSLFSIKTQSVPYKVSFYKPDSVIENYIIDFELQNKIIEI